MDGFQPRKRNKTMRCNPSVLVERCRNGERLAKTITKNRAGNSVVSFCLEPSGAHVTESQALGLLRSGKFVPVGDGLLGLESSQTWRFESGI
jgi:hypothetical protein